MLSFPPLASHPRSILPIWHIFERTLEYCALSRGAKLVYSSLRSFKVASRPLGTAGPLPTPPLILSHPLSLN